MYTTLKFRGVDGRRRRRFVCLYRLLRRFCLKRKKFSRPIRSLVGWVTKRKSPNSAAFFKFSFCVVLYYYGIINNSSCCSGVAFFCVVYEFDSFFVA